jgi:thymidylate synthase ThyX
MKIEGKGGISAKIVADSIANDIRIITIETASPFNIDAEIEKHRAISTNSSSGRAIPITVNTQLASYAPYLPFDVRNNQPGMQGIVETSGESLEEFLKDARRFRDESVSFVLKHKHIHKQHLNDYLKPFLLQKKVWTATEWDNFFNLRLHKDAKPEMQELAKCMKEAMESSRPNELKPGEWHLPYYYGSCTNERGEPQLDVAIKCSVARCARVSYANHDNTSPDIEKDIALADMLLEAGHMSPFEHQATPMVSVDSEYYYENFGYAPAPISYWEKGTTHVDSDHKYWSNNFRGWIQYRAML